jgi:hypothetical protein
MAKLIPLPEPTRKHLAEQIGRQHLHVFSGPKLTPEAKLGMGEDLEVWTLDMTKLKKVRSLTNIARPTGYWYHLVRRDGAAWKFAVSRLEKNRGERKIHGIVDSSACQAIDEVMKWIDEKDKSDACARLLFLPAYGLYAFWILAARKQQIVVIDLARPIKGLQAKRMQAPATFLKALASHRLSRFTPPKGSPPLHALRRSEVWS